MLHKHLAQNKNLVPTQAPHPQSAYTSLILISRSSSCCCSLQFIFATHPSHHSFSLENVVGFNILESHFCFDVSHAFEKLVALLSIFSVNVIHLFTNAFPSALDVAIHNF